MSAAGVPRERTLLVGDSFVDFETARQASVRCCLVSYGFGYRRFPRDTVGADLVVDDARGLHQALREFIDAGA
jgi:phosphoglycolate phosphatase-like HAD superfamily hydrolase